MILHVFWFWTVFIFYPVAESPEENPEANIAAVESEANEPPANRETNDEELGAVAAAAADETEREISGFRFSSTPYIRNLPGPSQVVTHPGTSGTNSNGQRQRRRGVSGPPTGRTSYKSRLILELIVSSQILVVTVLFYFF